MSHLHTKFRPLMAGMVGAEGLLFSTAEIQYNAVYFYVDM